MEFILKPVLAGVAPEETVKINQGISKRFGPIVWIIVIFLAMTGFLLLFRRGGIAVYDENLTFLLKMVLVGLMVVIGVLLAMTGLKIPEATSKEQAMSLSKRVTLLMRANIAVGIIVIFLAVGSANGGLF